MVLLNVDCLSLLVKPIIRLSIDLLNSIIKFAMWLPQNLKSDAALTITSLGIFDIKQPVIYREPVIPDYETFHETFLMASSCFKTVIEIMYLTVPIGKLLLNVNVKFI